MTRCDAAHDGHECTMPGACARALSAMLTRIDERAAADRGERENTERARRDVAAFVIWPTDPRWLIAGAVPVLGG